MILIIGWSIFSQYAINKVGVFKEGSGKLFKRSKLRNYETGDLSNFERERQKFFSKYKRLLFLLETQE